MNAHGFPEGYFVIRSVATNRVLDIKEDFVEDGTELLLWPEKEKSLVETLRDPIANNQVFFIDNSGALCSRSSGHALDVEGDRLVLRHRRPVSYPYPNAYSHPLPKFKYTPQTGEINVLFDHDPAYLPVSPTSPSSNTRLTSTTTRGSRSSFNSTSGSWRNKTYTLISQPLRKPRTMIDNASDLLTTAISSPMNFFSTAFGGKSSTRPEEVFDGNIDLREDDVVEEERGEEGEVDDSPELGRQLKVLGILKMEDVDVSEKALRRRQWQVLSLRTVNARTGM